MINFTLTSAGSSAIAGSTPVLIDGISLCDSNGDEVLSTIQNFSGNVVNDSGGVGNYLVVSFECTSGSGNVSVSMIKLKSGNSVIAESESVSVLVQENKITHIRMDCAFDGASKCTFNSIVIGIPYATPYREGTLRLARSTGELHKDKTVYSAQDVEQLIESGVSGAGKFVTWDLQSGSTDPDTGSTSVSTLNIVDDYDSPTHTASLTVNSSGNIVTDAYITGTAVDDTPNFSTSGGTTTISDTDTLVTGSYIAALYSDTVDTSVAQSDANKLVSSSAVKSYVEDKLDGTNNDYVHKAGAETISGAKTFTGGIVANSAISGTGIYSTYAAGSGTGGWENADSAAKLPTVGATAAAISAGDAAVTTAFQTADINLQSQIDGINAGQNLADIVDTKGDLVSHSLTDLKARGDYKSGDSGPTWAVGDKIQVLHDKTESDGTYSDETAPAVATVYELVKGTVPSGESAKSHASSTTGYYWHYIGEYGVDAYTKSEVDSTFVKIANLVGSSGIVDGATTVAPSADGVYDFVTSAISTASGDYVKLTSATKQTISSEIAIDTGTATGNNADTFTFKGSKLSTNGTSTIGAEYVITGEFNVTRTLGITLEPSTTTVYIGYFDSTQFGANATNAVIIDCNSGNVTGTAVADYADILPTPPAQATDGRLVTVDYLNAYTGDLSGYAKLSSNNTFTGTNTFSDDIIANDVITGTAVYSTYASATWSTATTQLPTVSTVKSAIADAKSDTLSEISNLDNVGSIGLFMYTEVGAEKAIGDTVSGAYLKPVGLSLPMSGQIAYKAVTPLNALTGTWTLLSLAMKRTATEPCLVLAQKTSAI